MSFYTAWAESGRSFTMMRTSVAAIHRLVGIYFSNFSFVQ